MSIDLTDAIAAAHAALDERFYPGPTEEMVRVAIEAAAPVIAAKALRNFADAMERDDWTHRDDWGVKHAYAVEVREHAAAIARTPKENANA